LVLFTEGKGYHTIDFVKYLVKPFQVYFMIPGQVHSWHFEGRVEGYIVHFNENLFSSFLHNSRYLEKFHFFSGNSEDCVCQLPSKIHSGIVQLFESLVNEAKGNLIQNLDMVRLKLLEFFVLVDRSCVAKKEKPIQQQKYVLLRNFQQLIDTHFREIKLPKEYAELLYVTPNHLNALCHDLVNKTAGELIRDRILLEAKRLLTNADMTIAEIADNLNFQDNSYFNRFFKKYTGVTPEEFKKQFINQ
jgi:AraC-like DNA-binding protein